MKNDSLNDKFIWLAYIAKSLNIDTDNVAYYSFNWMNLLYNIFRDGNVYYNTKSYYITPSYYSKMIIRDCVDNKIFNDFYKYITWN